MGYSSTSKLIKKASSFFSAPSQSWDNSLDIRKKNNFLCLVKIDEKRNKHKSQKPTKVLAINGRPCDRSRQNKS